MFFVKRLSSYEYICFRPPLSFRYEGTENEYLLSTYWNAVYAFDPRISWILSLGVSSFLLIGFPCIRRPNPTTFYVFLFPLLRTMWQPRHKREEWDYGPKRVERTHRGPFILLWRLWRPGIELRSTTYYLEEEARNTIISEHSSTYTTMREESVRGCECVCNIINYFIFFFT